METQTFRTCAKFTFKRITSFRPSPSCVLLLRSCLPCKLPWWPAAFYRDWLVDVSTWLCPPPWWECIVFWPLSSLNILLHLTLAMFPSSRGSGSWQLISSTAEATFPLTISSLFLPLFLCHYMFCLSPPLFSLFLNYTATSSPSLSVVLMRGNGEELY